MLLLINLCTFIICLTLSTTNADANLRTAFLPFGNLTNQFLATIQPNIDLDFLKVYIYQLIDQNSTISEPKEIFDKYWKIYVGYFILIIIGLLFIFLFTLVGLCLCCCRVCCKRCGVKPPKQLDNEIKRKRIAFNVILFLLTTLILIGAIVAMASNVILHDAFKPPNSTDDQAGNILGTVNITVSHAISYINYLSRNGMVNGTSVLLNTIQNVSSSLLKCVSLFTQTFQDRLQIGTVLNLSREIIDGYSNLTMQAQNLSSIAFSHNLTTVSFESYLSTVKSNLNTILQDNTCQTYNTQCNSIKSMLPSLIIGFNLSKINYTIDIFAIQVFNQFNISDLKDGQENVNNKINNISNEVDSTFRGYIKNFTDSLNGSTTLFKDFNNSFAFKDTFITTLNTIVNTISSVKVGNTSIYNYYKYIFYAFVVLISIILFVVLFFYLGLSFGIFGKSKCEKVSCCNKGCGSRFLMGAVAVSFIIGWLIMLIVMIMFVVGGLIETEGCRHLRVGSNNQTIKTLDELINKWIGKQNLTFNLIDITMGIPNVNMLQSVLIRCPVSIDLMSAFQIPTSYFSPISNFVFNKFINASLTSMVTKINDFNVQSINIDPIKNNTDKIIYIITQLKNQDSSTTITELRKNVTKLSSVSEFVDMIKNLASTSTSSNPDFANNLLSNISNLNEKVINMERLQTSYLQNKLNFNYSLNNLDDLVTKLNFILPNIVNNISEAKSESASITASWLGNTTKSLIASTIIDLIKSLGDCRGLSATVNSAIGIVCTVFLIPLNNIWMGMGWFLLLIVPAIIFALKLHAIYRIVQTDPRENYINKAYQDSHSFLTARDLEMIRMDRPHRIK